VFLLELFLFSKGKACNVRTLPPADFAFAAVNAEAAGEWRAH
jgi:hypothetical protein